MRKSFRQSRRFNCPRDIAPGTCDRLLQVWDLEWDPTTSSFPVPPKSYTDYWKNLIQEQRQHCQPLGLKYSEVIGNLVTIVRSGTDEHMHVLKTRIQNAYPSAKASSPITEDQAVTALSFIIQLWLHMDLDLKHQTLPSETLQTLVSRALPQPSVANHDLCLPRDFCAKHLWRKGGIKIEWTDKIDEHLSMIEDRCILVFRHTGMLRALDRTPTCNPFPAGFTSETLDTLYLLFRPREEKKVRRNIRRMEKSLDCDLELAMARHARFDLSYYKFWQERLLKIQQMFEQKRPSDLRQWWFDRRDRVQWATFWLAFLVLVLTIVFGLVQSVTGVFQAYAAYHPVTYRS